VWEPNQAGVPRVAHLVHDREAALPRQLLEGHVQVGRDPDHRLRRDGRGDPLDRRRPHGADGDACAGGGHRLDVQRVGREQLVERRRVLGEGLADTLRPLDEEATVLVTEGAFAEPARGADDGVAPAHACHPVGDVTPRV